MLGAVVPIPTNPELPFTYIVELTLTKVGNPALSIVWIVLFVHGDVATCVSALESIVRLSIVSLKYIVVVVL